MIEYCKSTNRKRPAAAFTLVELLVVIAIIGILVALLLPAIQAAREAARRSQCQSNIKNVALAVLNYETTMKKFPVGMTYDESKNPDLGHPIYFGPNWMIEILAYIEEQSTYDHFDLTARINGNGTTPGEIRNQEARGTQIPVLLCPTDGNNKVLYEGNYPAHGGNWARGNYAANAGGSFLFKGPCGPSPVGPDDYYCTEGPTGSAWADGKDGWKDNYRRRGVMGVNTAVAARQITDGMTKTIMIGEIRAGLSPKDSRGIWAMGHAGASLVAMFGSGGDANGPNACYANSDDVYCDLSLGDQNQSECMSCITDKYFAQAAVRSQHVGGAFLAMCDGSVQFTSDDIETSGENGPWGSPWDYMIGCADGSGQ
jgi:prepilin-type N-terminal cleavage/methylation domain-containing protein